MEAARTSETLVNFYQTTRCYNPEDSNLHTHRRENLKSYNPGFVSTRMCLTSPIPHIFSHWWCGVCVWGGGRLERCTLWSTLTFQRVLHATSRRSLLHQSSQIITAQHCVPIMPSDHSCINDSGILLNNNIPKVPSLSIVTEQCIPTMGQCWKTRQTDTVCHSLQFISQSAHLITSLLPT
jgi:hypothetical protein